MSPNGKAEESKGENSDVDLRYFASDVDPISNIKLYTELLAEQTSHREIEVIREQTEKLDFLIHALVKLSRMENGILSMHVKENKVALLFDAIKEQYEKKRRKRRFFLRWERRMFWRCLI